MNNVRRELDAIMENAAIERMEQNRIKAAAKRRLKRMKRRKCLSRMAQKLNLNNLLFESDKDAFRRN